MKAEPTLTTPRLHLRPLTPEDAEAFHRVWGDPSVIFWGAAEDLDDSRQRLAGFVARRVEGLEVSGWLGVERRHDGEFLGDVVLEPASWDASLPEIGWHFGKGHQGQGYATEAARALLDRAFADGASEVWAKILPDNEPSRRVAARIGMTAAGEVDHNGQNHELWVARPR